MTDINSKKNVAQLQKLVIDGLEDVKAQDIKVFNTESLSPLFERVIIASGTSNRQTKALASSVRDVVREAGFGKPRVEGEENGEWIIVDCGAVVAHIMQPAIREYYHLEEIWGEKPVRFKHGEDKMSELVKERAPKPSQSDSAGKTGKTGKAGKAGKGDKGDKDTKSSKSSKAATSAKGTSAKRGAKDRQAKPEKGDEKVSAKRASPTKSVAPGSRSKPKSAANANANANATSTPNAKPRAKAATKTSPKTGDKATKQSTTSVAKTLSNARTKSASSKSKAGSSAPTVKTRNSPPRA